MRSYLREFFVSPFTVIVFVGLVIITGLLLLMGCSPESKAKDDIEDKFIKVHKAQTDVISSSNSFPNISHTCWNTTGFWTTTDRLVIIVYNDPMCEGSNPQRAPFVVSNVPQRVVSSGG